jgi:hypothetical protein
MFKYIKYIIYVLVCNQLVRCNYQNINTIHITLKTRRYFILQLLIINYRQFHSSYPALRKSPIVNTIIRYKQLISYCLMHVQIYNIYIYILYFRYSSDTIQYIIHVNPRVIFPFMLRICIHDNYIPNVVNIELSTET